MRKKMVSLVPTPHIGAKKNEIARHVLMPGDPQRAKYIAKKYLRNPKLVTSIRGILGYTGFYKQKKITIIAHGIGIPSIGIYAYELFNFYDVSTIYRIGSAGSYQKDLGVGAVVLVKKAWNDSNVSKWWNVVEDEKNIFYPTKKCNDNILKTAKKMKINIFQKNVSSEDCFYKDYSVLNARKLMGNVNVCEMESYALFALAKKFNKKAACLLTISDNLITKISMSANQRINNFNQMIKLALEAIINE